MIRHNTKEAWRIQPKENEKGRTGVHREKVQRSLPITQQGLSNNTESSRAGQLSKPGKHKGRDDRRMEKDEDILQWEAVFDTLLSHAHPDGLQLWLEEAGHGERLYLQQGLQQHSNLQRRTGVG